MSFDLTASRLNAGHTRVSLAEAVGVPRYTVDRLEKGLSIHPASAKRIADYFGVKVTDLMPAQQRDAA